MAKKALKAQLYDKPRYAFDEEQLFHHFDKEDDRKDFETKTFPWWKPVWVKTDDNHPNVPKNYWSFVNPSGKFFDFDEIHGELLFPENQQHFVASSSYHWSPVFFIIWMKTIVYDRSICLWNQKEKEFKAEFPNKRPDQIARMCDDEVAKFFLNLKG